MSDENQEPVHTPDGAPAVRIRQKAPHGHMHVIVAVDVKRNVELEVFAQIGKAGGLPCGNLEAICRMVSLYLRIGGSLDDVIEQLDGIGSNMSVLSKDGSISSMGDALAKALRRYRDAKATHGLEAILLGAVDLEKE